MIIILSTLLPVLVKGLITLDGSGTTNPSKFYWEIMSLFEAQAKPSVKMTYRAVGSSTGQLEFIGADQDYAAYNDFGSGDIPLDSDEYTELTGQGVTVLHVPFSLGAMSFFHNVPDAPSDGLRLTSCVLADIFNRDITTWDDDEILALNPDFSPPSGQPIKVYHRVFGSSTTAGITTYLHAACPSKWPESQVGSTIDWAEGTFEAQGSGGMSAAISGEEYTIGYIDSGHGHDDSLFEIALQNDFGTYQTSIEASANGGVKAAADEALQLGVLPSDPTADFSAVSLHNMPGEFTWPIVAISYLYLRADQTENGEKGALLKAFVEYVLSDDGQELLTKYNFEGVPADVLEVAESALTLLELPSDADEWTFESADSTDPGTGQQDYVISGKRRSYDEYAITELESEKADVSDLEALEVEVSSLQTRVSSSSGLIALHGSGTTNPSKFYWEIMSLFEAQAKPSVKMTYRAVGSSTGQLEFIGADQDYAAYNDFGSGDIPLDSDEYSELTGQGVTVLHVPFSLGAMSFFHNVPDAPSDGLRLTSCVLADIFNRDITTWDDDEILALNPDFSPPSGQPIKVYHRVFGSSTTAGITTYLHAACPSKWPESQVGSTIDWAEGTFEAQGSGGMSAAISGEEYTIGYIDSGHGHDDGLFEIALQNDFGTYQTSIEASANGGVKAAADEALQLGVLPSDPTADFSAVSLHNMPGEFTWPIVAISYLYLRADQTENGEKGALLKAFVEYVLSDDGQELLTKYNFEGVPADVLNVALDALNSLSLPDGISEWTFESADSTDPGTGQQDYVISGKRRSYDEYAITELESEKADVSDLEALEAEVASLSFQLSSGVSTSGGFIALHGSGTTNPSKFYWEIMSLFEAQAKPSVKMTYRAVGSSTGQLEFIGADQDYAAYNDFGSGDIPLDSDEYTELTGQGVTVLHVPFSLGAMSFFHNVPDAPSDGLRLTSCVLADIFNRDITTWDDDEILALNPDFSPPSGQPIKVYHRVFGSSTTAGITTYLHAACPSKWPESQVGSTIDWADGTFEAQGSGGMSAAISGEEYTIGYIDSGHGHDDGLFEIALQNDFGTYQTSIEASANGGVKAAADEALQLGVLPSDPTADFSAVSLHNMPGEFTWPIVAISYLYLRADQTENGEKGALLKAFVEYVLSDDGQELLTKYNFEGVPADVLAVSMDALSRLELPDGSTEWTFESADSTDPGTGQQDYVISGKRRSYDEYAITELESEKADVSDLEALEAEVESMASEMTTLKDGCSCDSDNNNSAKRLARIALILAIIGLIFGLAGIILGIMAYMRVNRMFSSSQQNGRSASEICLPQMKKENGNAAYTDLEQERNALQI